MLGAAAAAAAAANPFVASSRCCCYQQRAPYVLGSQYPKPLISQLGPQRLLSSPWSGLKHLPIKSASFHGLNKEKKGKCRGKAVYASLFGVGVPEALVIGVVALLVFGPKGLAEVARNLGKTLRAFQPTIKELQDVSREFKSTLEREIGLDDTASSANNTYKPPSFSNESQQATIDPNGTPKSGAYTSEDRLKITQEQLAASATQESQTQGSSGLPQEQKQDVMAADAPSTDSGIITPEAAAQIQSSGKTDKES